MAVITSPTTTAQQSTDSSDKAGIIDSDTPHHKHQQHLDALLSRMISAKDVHKHSGGGGGSGGTAQTNVVSSKLSFRSGH